MHRNGYVIVEDVTRGMAKKALQRWVNVSREDCVHAVKRDGVLMGVALLFGDAGPGSGKTGIEYIPASELGIIRTYPLP